MTEQQSQLPLQNQPNLKKTVITIPNDFKTIEKEINIILDKNEDAIRHYISRYIYASSISSATDKELSQLFKQIRIELGYLPSN